MKYDVAADIYEGPLPLLVELAKLNLINVFLIKLVDLTESYVSRVKESVGEPAATNLNELSEPMPLLGTLVAIKARGLLPVPPRPDEDEDIPISLEELERRLKEYEQFKTVAQLLSELHALQHRHFTRSPAASPEEAGEGEGTANGGPLEVSLTALMSAFAKVLAKATVPVYEVTPEPRTVEGLRWARRCMTA